MSNKELIYKSYDYRYYRRGVITFSVLYSVFGILLAVMFALLGNPEGSIILAVIMLILCAPLIGYYVYKLLYVSKNSSGYRLYNIVSAEMHPSFRGRMYLTIKLRDDAGLVFAVDSNGIFSPYTASDICFDSEYRKKSRVLYDDSGGRLLVLCE